MRILAFSVLLLMANFCYAASCSVGNLQPSLQIMAQRAQLMRQAAAYKYTHNAPIYSSKEEVTILQHVNTIAKQQHLDPQSLMLFAQIQMDMSKHIESYWIHYWETHPNARPNPNHVASSMKLKWQLIGIGRKLYPAISSALPDYHACTMPQLTMAFNHNFSHIAGIPHDPDYAVIYLSTLKHIKHAST